VARSLQQQPGASGVSCRPCTPTPWQDALLRRAIQPFMRMMIR
jgi:hypothetical protein